MKAHNGMAGSPEGLPSLGPSLCLKQVLAPRLPRSSLGKSLLSYACPCMPGLGNDPFCQKPQWKGCGNYFTLDHNVLSN